MKKLTWNIIYLLKFTIYGGISAYNYSINSKWTFAWLILALLMLAIWIVGEIEDLIKK